MLPILAKFVNVMVLNPEIPSFLLSNSEKKVSKLGNMSVNEISYLHLNSTNNITSSSNCVGDPRFNDICSARTPFS